ncbi:MAG: hypothetical protein ACRD3Y_03590 [Bryobacteraceae bacterium]
MRRQKLVTFVENTASELLSRIERLERENAQLAARIEAEAELRAKVAAPPQPPDLPPPPRRGRAGGLARIAQVQRFKERWPDGQFMAHEDWENIEREVQYSLYMRHAAGGYARAESAARYADGTFAPRDERPETPR